jgi:hypothetical protein
MPHIVLPLMIDTMLGFTHFSSQEDVLIVQHKQEVEDAARVLYEGYEDLVEESQRAEEHEDESITRLREEE